MQKAADPAFDEMGKNVAMQIAAMNPAYLDEASVPAEVIEHEQGILAAQMKEDPKMVSKPEAVLAKIAAGKMGKYYKRKTALLSRSLFAQIFSRVQLRAILMMLLRSLAQRLRLTALFV